MREIGHFIGGKHVAGTSGRSQRCAAAHGRRGARPRWRSPRRLKCGAAVENAKAAQPAWAATNPQRRARVMMKFRGAVQPRMRQARRTALPRTRQDHSRRQGRHPARPRSGRILHRRAAYAERRVHRRRRPRHRPLFNAPAAGCGRRHHPVQLSGHDSAVEDGAGARLRQCLHPEAFRARPRRADDASPNSSSRPDCRPASSMSSTATRKPSTPFSTIRTSRPSASWARRRSPNISTAAAVRPESASSASAAPRTT